MFLAPITITLTIFIISINSVQYFISQSDFFLLFFWLDPKEPKTQGKRECLRPPCHLRLSKVRLCAASLDNLYSLFLNDITLSSAFYCLKQNGRLSRCHFLTFLPLNFYFTLFLTPQTSILTSFPSLPPTISPSFLYQPLK